MADMANVLKAHVIKHKLYTPIAGKNYAHVEGWMFAGGMLGLFAKVVGVKDLSSGANVKWMAEVEIARLKDDKIIGRGFALCSNKESKRRNADEYVICSMAQTRAIGKAYRNIIGWVMKLAGYSGTPAEEMTKVGETPPEPVEAQPVTRGAMKQTGKPDECHKCAAVITKQEFNFSKRIFGKPLCRDCQKTARAKRR